MSLSKSIFSSTGNFTVPSGVNYITVEAWGAGGSGGYSSRFGGRGGGGSGGSYVKKQNIPVVPGTSLTVTVGQGGVGNRDSWVGSVSTVIAKGGLDGNNATGGTVFATGASGSIDGCIGSIIFKGGNGGNGVDAGSGGGGGGGGTIENGSDAISNIGGAGGDTFVFLPTPYGGGNGANGVSPGNNGSTGFNYGGGGSGGANTDLGSSTRNGGVGGNGIVVITYSTQPLAPIIYSDCCTLEIGCYLYSDSTLTTPVDEGMYYDGTDCLIVNSEGIVTSLGSCTPTQHCLGYYSPSTDSNQDACYAYDLYTTCIEDIYIYASETGSFKYVSCSGDIAYGVIPENTPYIDGVYEYFFTGSCLRYSSITTENILPPILPPATITGVDYEISSSACGTFSGSCGC
jgi:hypothetical protein